MDDEEAEYQYVLKGGKEGEEEEERNWLAKPGAATVSYPNGDTFDGTFDGERQKEGEGTYTWVLKDEDDEAKPIGSYAGNYANGKRNGFGAMTFPSGDRYTGDFKDGLMHGEGTYEYANGDIYSGSFADNAKAGQGEDEFGADGSKMVGTWAAGSITEGKWLFADGSYYTGAFSEGRPTGAGSFTFTNGITQTGAYVPAATNEDEDGDEDEDEDEAAPRPLVWRGDAVVVV